MRLIFKQEIEFLRRELGITIPEHTAFMDRMCVKVLDRENKWHILYKIKAKNMELRLVKANKTHINNIKIWNEIIKGNEEHLDSIERESIETIKQYIRTFNDYNIVVPVSGGKDSAITHYLVNKAIDELKQDRSFRFKVNVLTVFSNTTNETHHTYKYIKENYPKALVITPKEGFYPLIHRTGTVPSRFNRLCCSLCKEMPMIEQLDKNIKYLFFMGMRAAESQKRSEYATEWKNHRWTSKVWQGILPILQWSDIDVLLFQLSRNIPINGLYSMGYNRVGCVNCCYRSDYELILNKEFLTQYHNRWQLILEKDFIENKKAPSLNCSLQEYKNGSWRGGIVHTEPTEETIQEFSTQQGMDINIARKYFNKICMCCSKKLKKDDIGMSMKYFGRNIENFKCLNCLGKDVGLTKKELKEKTKDFKNQDCVLF